jgi:hypothetical protein
VGTESTATDAAFGSVGAEVVASGAGSADTGTGSSDTEAGLVWTVAAIGVTGTGLESTDDAPEFESSHSVEDANDGGVARNASSAAMETIVVAAFMFRVIFIGL